MDSLELLFVTWAFVFQAILIAHFAVRKWHFHTALRYGWIVYMLGIPAFLLSMVLLLNGKVWWLWAAGFIHLVWAVYACVVEYVRKIEWRDPIRWSVFAPYIFLYLSTIMFYWWPLARFSHSLWFLYTVLFLISTVLNIGSHAGSGEERSMARG